MHVEPISFQELRFGGSALFSRVHELRGGREFAVGEPGVVERAVFGLAYGNAVFGGVEVEMLITSKQYGNNGSVGLRALYRHALRRTGIQQGACQADCQSKKQTSFHG